MYFDNKLFYATFRLAFLKELILIIQVHQVSVIFVTIGIFEIKYLISNLMSAMMY